MSDTTPVGRVYECLVQVVGEVSVNAQLRELAADSDWYTSVLPTMEVLRLWLGDQLRVPRSPEWIFGFVRADERRLLCQAAGVDLVGGESQRPREMATRILTTLGIYVADDTNDAFASWQDLRGIIGQNSERAAVEARQRSERFLRVLMYFYTARFPAELSTILKQPGKLRVPSALRDVADRKDDLLDVIRTDGILDLGFLSLCLRAFSERCRDAATRHPSGTVLDFFNGRDLAAFLGLARALQAFHHDNPSLVANRDPDLRNAFDGVHSQVLDMAARRTIPQKIVVVETNCLSPLGPIFRGVTATERSIVLTASEGAPPLGTVVRFVSSCNHEFANCWWNESPW